ncbi:MAG: response regulator [Devosia sp.]|nr:response regulator [Devosia sp.]
MIDDDPVDTRYVQFLLSHSTEFKLNVVAAHKIADVRGLLSTQYFDVALVDFWLGSDTSTALVEELAKRYLIPTVMLTGMNALMARESSFRAGASGFLSKHALSSEVLERAITTALRSGLLHRELMAGEARLVEQMTSTAAVERMLTIIYDGLRSIERTLSPYRSEVSKCEVGAASMRTSLLAAAAEAAFLRREAGLRLDLIQEGTVGPPIEFERFDLIATLAGVVAELESERRRREIEIVVRTTGELWLTSDRSFVADMIANLLMNALEENEAGAKVHICADIHERNAFIVLFDGRKTITLDEVAASLHHRIKLPALASISESVRGWRLQLAARVAERLQGVLDIDGMEDEGATVVISFPLERPS